MNTGTQTTTSNTLAITLAARWAWTGSQVP